MRAGRWAGVLAAVVLVAASCTGGRIELAEPSRSAGNAVHPPAPQSEANPLCKPIPAGGEPGPSGSSLPRDVGRVADQVQDVRGLRFLTPVVPEPLSRDAMARELTDSLERQFPPDLAAREQQTWITIGALPSGTDLRQTVIDFGTSQIIGFYDSDHKRLVFEGGASPTPFERFTLAHELTHALQDQHFDLGRLDRLNNTCQDERAEAFLSLIEGDAVETQLAWARDNLSSEELLQLQNQAQAFPAPPPTPPFVENQFLFPYSNGQMFVEALQQDGGEQAVDAALRDPPVSTEQVLHPDKYPEDVPQAVQIPDLSDRLGSAWHLLDQEDVGEGWLLTLLELRLSDGDSEDAAAGWDGGLLRSWTDGSETAALIRTVWDSERDAGEFAGAMKDWIDRLSSHVQQDGTQVQVLFASDDQTLASLSEAASS